MIRRLLATLGILLSLMIVLAFTITLPEQSVEPTATTEDSQYTPVTRTSEANYIETAVAQELTQPRLTPLNSWAQTATQIVLTVTEGAPGYQTPESATIIAESITSTAIYIEYVRDFILNELTSTAYAVTFVPTYTAIAETQERVEATRTTLASATLSTPVPLFGTATEVTNLQLTGTSTLCYFDESFTSTSLDASITNQIRAELETLNPDLWIRFQTYTYRLSPIYFGSLCQDMTYSQLTIETGSFYLEKGEIPSSVDDTLAILEQHLSEGYEAVFPSPRIAFSWRVYEDQDFYHFVQLNADYNTILVLYQSGLRGEDLIEALGGLYPYLEKSYFG